MIATLSGILGYEPSGTLRELIWSVDAKQKSDWDHTSELLANQTNLAAKKHVTSARRIHPFRNEKPVVQELTLNDLSDLVEF